jgi:hypothetical protein
VSILVADRPAVKQFLTLNLHHLPGQLIDQSSTHFGVVTDPFIQV